MNETTAEQKFEVILEDQNPRLDVYLAGKIEVSRSDLQKHILAGKVLVNGKTVKPSYTIKNADKIELEEITAKEDYHLLANSDIKLNIIFEDEDILILNKPRDIQVHPDTHNQTDSLIQAVAHYYPQIVNVVYNPESEISRLRPGVVHRLDKDTSGVIIMAKNTESLLNLSDQFHSRTVSKKYLALLYGELLEEKRVETYIRRKPVSQNMMGICKDPQLGKLAISIFKPIEVFTYHDEKVTLASCSIETGRTHQIRVHAKYIGNPVLGDPLYYSKTSRKYSLKLGAEHQLLHAQEVSFKHPKTNELVTFSAPVPADFEAIEATLRSGNPHK